MAIALLLLFSGGRSLIANQPALDEDQIKAGFLFNFMRFVEWPDKAYAASSSPISICIVGDTPIFPLLTDAAAGKVVEGRPVLVKSAKSTDDLHSCNLLFIASSESGHAKHILQQLAGSTVLTVGETPGFAQSGGILNFFTEDNKVRLELNLDAAAHANLKISAKLIAVSRLATEKRLPGAE